jgi:transposase
MGKSAENGVLRHLSCRFVLGIVDSDGVAVGIPGIALANLDAEKLRLEQVLANGLGPRRIKGIFQRGDGVIPGLRKESIFRSWIFPADESSVCTAAPHFAHDTRGKLRVDDCRVISGIIHSLASGCRSKGAPTVYGPRKALYNRFQRWTAKGVWADVFHALASAGGPPEEVLTDSSAVKAHRCAAGGKRGERSQAIGRSRGGRTTKVHALTDACCRPIALLLTGGQVADCTADTLLDQLNRAVLVQGNKSYDTNAANSRPGAPHQIFRSR